MAFSGSLESSQVLAQKTGGFMEGNGKVRDTSIPPIVNVLILLSLLAAVIA